MPVYAAAADAAQGWASGLAWPRGGRDEETWQRAVLAEELASLDPGEWEPPSEEELWGCAPDPDSDPPGDAEADVPAQVWAGLAAAHTAAAADTPGTPAPHPALAGFGDGGALDMLAPGAALAGVAAAAWSGGLDRLDEDELIGMVRAWRRLSSWAAAGELTAAAELMARCARGHDGGGRCQPVDCVAGELACALTLTRRGADALVDRALRLAELPATAAALRQGRIDVPKMLVIGDGVAALDPQVTRMIEDMVLAKAASQTTGELRAAVRRAVLAADPAAAQARRETAQKDARVELWDEPAGTKALAGRDLPPADVLAADKRISAIARELKGAGAAGPLDLLRAKVYLALLAGHPLDQLLPTTGATDPGDPAGTYSLPGTNGIPGTNGLPGTGGAARAAGAADQSAARETGTAISAPAHPGSALAGSNSSDSDNSGSGTRAMADIGRGASAGPAAAPALGEMAGTPAVSFLGGLGVLAGSVNLTVPLDTLLRLAESPGEVAGFGPVDAATSRLLAGAAAQHRATSWCLTVTGPTGRVIGHGCARRPRAGPAHAAGGDPAAGGTSMNLAITIDPLAFAACAHDRETAGYQLTPRLRHLIETRDQTCSFPGCRQPTTRCDMEASDVPPVRHVEPVL